MSTEDDKQSKRGFKVDDRRRFSETGDVRPEHRDSDTVNAPADVHPASEAPALEDTAADVGAMELNFSTFLLSLSTQALAHLGEIPDPINQRIEVDLGAAKQMIDILGILKEKTKGNLDKVEAGLLEGVLYDLRLKYVERARSGSQGT